MDLLAQGLTLSISGLTVTFLSLGLFILVMVVLQALFKPESERAKKESPQEAVVLAEVEAVSIDDEVVAAIAIAVAHFESPVRSKSLGEALLERPGAWWVANRANANQGK